MLAEDIPDADPFFAQIWASCFVNEFIQPGGTHYRKVLFVHRGYHLWFYFGERDSDTVGEFLANKFLQRPQFTVRANTEILRWSDKLRDVAERVPETRLSALSNRQLWGWFREHDRVHTEYYQWGWLPVAVDMFHDNLTKRLKQFLREHVSEDRVNEYLVILTQPRRTSLIQIEQEEFLALAARIYRDRSQRALFSQLLQQFQDQAATPYGLKTHTPEYERLLEERMDRIRDQIKPALLRHIHRHYRTYFYVKHMWIGKDGVYTLDHYLKELTKLIGSGINPSVQLRQLRREFRRQVAKRNRLMGKLKIRDPWKTVLDSWGDFMVTKIYRRYAQIYAVYRMQPILQEIGRRLGFTLKETKFMLTAEIKAGLLQGRKPRRVLLQQRSRLSVFYYEHNLAQAYVGARANRLVRQVEKKTATTVTEISGQVGCVGKAVGSVKVIIRPSDMAKMRPGDILVSIATDPDIVSAMKKAAAIVTEQGGVTSHAAIVARELKIPCVIGTKIATRVLKDGDRVEVDAYKGVVKKI